ncbi:hypothetical protein RB653_008386 [Dictyostelium firmibasis]|uniref:PPM-type phosphatase domain-containing protein n=1 Tax=Dictyostelium firmibasis TaxID=79012 RepID=A0AAN7TZM4_9MYCE
MSINQNGIYVQPQQNIVSTNVVSATPITTTPTQLTTSISSLSQQYQQYQLQQQQQQQQQNVQPTQQQTINIESPINCNLKLNNVNLEKITTFEQFQQLDIVQQSQLFNQLHESFLNLSSHDGKQIGRLKIKQTSIDVINLEIESNPNYEVIVQNNTKKFYFKGMINSVGKQQGICEDSHFLSKDFTTIGVADGVGSWRSVGVDPGEYSRFLMSYIYGQTLTTPYLKPYELIESAYRESVNIPGSSTICILKIIGSKVYSGLVGDSSFIQIRKDQIHFRSNEQTHKPNFPYQLGQNSVDKPSSGVYMEHPVQENDIFVIGTDGFFDNIFDQEIVKAIKEVNSIESFFKCLLELAKSKSQDPEAQTPLGQRIGKVGGKNDDITVGCFVITKLNK